MAILNSSVMYALLLVLSTAKRSFEQLGKIAKMGGKEIRRRLPKSEISLRKSHVIALRLFKNCTVLTLIIDDTLMKKIHSHGMVGSAWHFDTKTNSTVKSYRLLAAAITNGRFTIPIEFGFMFPKEILMSLDQEKSKLDFIKEFYDSATRLFPEKKIKIAADGLFASVEFLLWCSSNNIDVIVRMHSNRKVECKGISHKIREMKELMPRGKQMARTIQVRWHELILYLTAERRIDKHGNESIVFLAATYKQRPRQYIHDYKLRWPIEKFFRTSKHYLGLEECFSRKLHVQTDHVASVFLAYALAQREMKNKKLKTPEQAIRAIKQGKLPGLIIRFDRLDQIFDGVYA